MTIFPRKNTGHAANTHQLKNTLEGNVRMNWKTATKIITKIERIVVKIRDDECSNEFMVKVVEKCLELAKENPSILVKLRDSTYQSTLLHWASTSGCVTAVASLLKESFKNHVDITSPGNQVTALHFAIYHKHENIVKLLLEHYASLHTECVINNTIETPLSLAQKVDNMAIKTLIEEHEQKLHPLQTLVEKIVWTIKQGDYSANFFFPSVQECIKEANKLKIPLSEICDKKEGSSLLHWACDIGDVEAVKLLAEGAFKEKLNKNNRYYEASPLILAAKKGHFSTVEYLLSQITFSSDEIHILDTALEYAVLGKHTAIQPLLRNHGAAKTLALPNDKSISLIKRERKASATFQDENARSLLQLKKEGQPLSLAQEIYLLIELQEKALLNWKGKEIQADIAESMESPLLREIGEFMVRAGEGIGIFIDNKAPGMRSLGTVKAPSHKRLRIRGDEAKTIENLYIFPHDVNGVFADRNSIIFSNIASHQKWCTIVHEVSHYMIKILFNHPDCAPFPPTIKGVPSPLEIEFTKVVRSLRANLTDLPDDPIANTIRRAFNVSPAKQPGELIVRVPEILATIGHKKGTQWLEEYTPQLFSYYKNTLLPKITEYNKKNPRAVGNLRILAHNQQTSNDRGY